MDTRPSSHAPIRLAKYWRIHETVMGQFRKRGFVGDDSLTFENLNSSAIIQGEIACLGMLIVTVFKTLDILTIDGDPTYVQTIEYSYNLSIRGAGNVFRCDNNHPDYRHAGHSGAHHMHFFNWTTGDELPRGQSPIESSWPTLGDFLEMSSNWYYENRSSLESPDSFVPRGQLRDGVQG